MNKVNFLTHTSFPLSSDTLDFMQKISQDLGAFTAFGGQSYILSGCTENGSSVSSGYIVVNGELLPFVGGTKGPTVIISEISENIQVYDTTYANVYVKREARFGSGSPEYPWSSFKRISDLLTMKELIDTLTRKVDAIIPTGTVTSFAGTVAPEGWLLCNGGQYNVSQYEDLFNVIGYTNGGNGTKFYVPNLTGRFVVGYNPYGLTTPKNAYGKELNYGAIGNTGGRDAHSLSASEMPKHRHVYSDDSHATGKFTVDGSSFPVRYSTYHNGGSSGSGSGGGQLYYSTYQGGYDSHENRPPYYVLAYIIKT